MERLFTFENDQRELNKYLALLVDQSLQKTDALSPVFHLNQIFTRIFDVSQEEDLNSQILNELTLIPGSDDLSDKFQFLSYFIDSLNRIPTELSANLLLIGIHHKTRFDQADTFSHFFDGADQKADQKADHKAFELGELLDGENINANFKDGILSVDVPKIEPEKPKKHTVKIG